MWLFVLLLSVAVLSFLLGVTAVFWWLVPRLENRFVFRPEKRIFQTPSDRGIPFRKVFFEARDGVRLSAWHLSPASPRAAVLYFHGNSGNLGLFSEVFELLYRNGMEIFAVDYRGYGQSEGSPSETGIHLDAEATVEYFLQHLKPAQLPLLYWGRSLGSCMAAYATAHRQPDGLILESGFPSKKSLLKYFPQFRALHLFSKCRLDTAGYLSGHAFPVLVIHGDKDRTIPLEEGQILFAGLSGPKFFHLVKGADHINTHRTNSRSYMDRILGFVEECRPERGQ